MLTIGSISRKRIAVVLSALQQDVNTIAVMGIQLDLLDDQYNGWRDIRDNHFTTQTAKDSADENLPILNYFFTTDKSESYYDNTVLAWLAYQDWLQGIPSIYHTHTGWSGGEAGFLGWVGYMANLKNSAMLTDVPLSF